jgi:hypothetical protein
MSTTKQIEANRANAKKSTGPRTSTGKSISARNRSRHAALAAAVVLEGESLSRFYQVLDFLISEFKPATASENILVENMAVARWRQMRIWRFESAAVLQERPTLAEDLQCLHRFEKAYLRMFAMNRNSLKNFRSLSAQQFPSPLRELDDRLR